jgi:pyrroline-5-carboxylate reductase
MLEGKKIAVIGSGKMGSIIAQGIMSKQIISVSNITMTDIDVKRLNFLSDSLGLHVSKENEKTAKIADIIILSVSPQNMAQTLKDIASAVNKSKLVISIAAGITTAFVESNLAHGIRVVRAMPNTPTIIGAGATAVAGGANSTTNDINLTRTIFDSLGITVEVDEKLMDAVTGLSGSGPAYCFVIMEALSDAGVQMGLPRDLSLKLAAQTVLGSAMLCLKGDKHPAQLKDMVTSPAGTTAAGLQALEEGKIRATVIAAVEAATKRSKELAGGK